MADKNFGAVINQSQAATVSSSAIDMVNMVGMSIHVIHGNVTGTLILEATNDPSDSDAWVTAADAALTSPAGTASKSLREIGNTRSRYYRVSYTHSSGTGSLKVLVNGKGVG